MSSGRSPTPIWRSISSRRRAAGCPAALLHPRRRARAARRDRSRDGRPHGGDRDGAGGRRRRRGLRGPGTARAARGRSRGPGARRRRARAAQALVEEAGLGDYSTSALVHAATARVALHEGRHEDARAALARAHRLRPLLDHGLPWLTVQVGLELTRAHLALADAGAARTVLAETEQVLELRPRHGLAGRGCARAARARRGDLRAGRRLGDEPDRRGAAAASVPRHPSHVPGDREPGCSSRATPSRPRRSRSTASSASRRAARRSSAPSRSGSWRARSIRRRRISPWKDDAPAGRSRSHVASAWTSTRSTCAGSPSTTRRSSRRSRWKAARSRRRSSTSGPRHCARRRDDRRRRGAFLVPARRGARARGRGDERRDRRHASRR